MREADVKIGCLIPEGHFRMHVIFVVNISNIQCNIIIKNQQVQTNTVEKCQNLEVDTMILISKQITNNKTEGEI